MSGKVTDVLIESESVTLKVTFCEPEVVGVPDRAPVEGLRLSHAGGEAEVIDQV